MKARLAALLAAVTLLSLSPALAQTHRASLRGTVTDPNGAVVVGAAVSVVNTETNEARAATSDGEGNYAVSSLPPGLYRVEVAASGFEKFAREIKLEVNQESRLDAGLGISQVAVELDGPESLAPILREDSAAVGVVISERQIAQLPLDGRNFLELALLAPGTAPSAPGSAGSVRGDFAFSVNGAREDSNNFLLDGVYNVDPKLNTFSVRPPVDAVREFEVLTNSYDASFGRNAGGQINVVLKSGTNNFHGTLYEFHRNQFFDARNFFAPADSDPKYIRNQFGFSLGGPVRRDKTFFFADSEGTRAREGVTRVTNVPTVRERNGDFSQTFDAGGCLVFVRDPTAVDAQGNSLPCVLFG
ncbi:MAG TPA: carboxypeptidase regulatory-like domain-containing protein, partial [Pyrinomonadaceae bacterium]|nr:carboxypeptidase regulatory-like domain-containing protein [Pyrinomonadaceae bacterium]